MSDDEGLKVYYWPRYDEILVEGYECDDGKFVFECPPIVVKTHKNFVWTIFPRTHDELIEIGEL